MKKSVISRNHTGDKLRLLNCSDENGIDNKYDLNDGKVVAVVGDDAFENKTSASVVKLFSIFFNH